MAKMMDIDIYLQYLPSFDRLVEISDTPNPINVMRMALCYYAFYEKFVLAVPGAIFTAHSNNDDFMEIETEMAQARLVEKIRLDLQDLLQGGGEWTDPSTLSQRVTKALALYEQIAMVKSQNLKIAILFDDGQFEDCDLEFHTGENHPTRNIVVPFPPAPGLYLN